MIILVSPAKSIRNDFKYPETGFSSPDFNEQAIKLANKLKRMSQKSLQNLLKVNSKIAELNYHRFQRFSSEAESSHLLPAAFAFIGDVYRTLEIEKFSTEDLLYAQNHFRILSGLYGILRPLDLIQEYRLEMGTKLSNGRNKDLYGLWTKHIYAHLTDLMETQNSDLIINLASNEYFKAVDTKKLNAKVITPVFKDYSQGKYKVMGLFAKRARGAMSSYILKNRMEDPEQIKLFDWDGYYYSDHDSSETEIVFTRG